MGRADLASMLQPGQIPSPTMFAVVIFPASVMWWHANGVSTTF